MILQSYLCGFSDRITQPLFEVDPDEGVDVAETNASGTDSKLSNENENEDANCSVPLKRKPVDQSCDE